MMMNAMSMSPRRPDADAWRWVAEQWIERPLVVLAVVSIFCAISYVAYRLDPMNRKPKGAAGA